MQTVRNKTLISGGLFVLFGILIFLRKTKLGHCDHFIANPDMSIRGKLLNSKRSLEQTASVLQSVIDEMSPETREYTDGSND